MIRRTRVARQPGAQPEGRPRRPRRILAALLGASLLASGAAAVVSTVVQAEPVIGSPEGHADTLKVVPGGIAVSGWTFDPDAPTVSLTVYLYIDSKLSGIRANQPRPDVAAAYPEAGPNHGFATTVRLPEGLHNVCAVAGNVLAGANTTLACAALTVADTPRGRVDTLKAVPGGITLSGWTFDPDAPTATLTVYLYIDSKLSGIHADQPRPDVAAAYPEAGQNHGFALTGRLAEGPHHICAVAGNLSYGASKTLTCQTITVADTPKGRVDTMTQAPGGVTISGWTFDPDVPTATLTVYLYIDTKLSGAHADQPRPDVAAAYPAAGPNHGFALTRQLPEGSHHICAVAGNLSYGASKTLTCRTITLRYSPTTALTAIAASATGARISGWASDPDTTAPIAVRINADGTHVGQLTAGGTGTTHTGHRFVAALTLRSGVHRICTLGVNVAYGAGNGSPSCQSVTLRLNPFGRFDSLGRAPGSANLLVRGWAVDPDTTSPIQVSVSVDHATPVVVTAGVSRPDVAAVYPIYGSLHGYSPTISASDGEHLVCVTALNVFGGTRNVPLGCKIINAVHPLVPGAPRSVGAVPDYGAATVRWIAPASDGGAPVSEYTVTATPGGATVSVPARQTSAIVLGLASNTRYTFAVIARNVVGASAASLSPSVVTPIGVPPQTSPAPISTSRYIRNISGSSATDLDKMSAEGATDAKNNPSGHRYLILLDIGGQDEADHGVLLSATTRFVSYTDLVRDLNAYVDGYASLQKPSAPVTIAIGTNNDMDVSSSSGATWAGTVVNPVLSHAVHHADMIIAGANDIEPGFRGTYTQTKAWLSGYLVTTKAPFVFNGSADGCAWTVTGSGCNNGWTMAGLYQLSAGAANTRIVNLPQIYNDTMAAQWKYISLTGVSQSRPRINFGGALTEFTACLQAGGCGSLTGNDAWTQMWDQLQSHPALRIASLPYSTDLRIDR